jgi:hypothetical protein
MHQARAAEELMPRALRLKGAEKAYALEVEFSAPAKPLEERPFGAGRRDP